MKTYFHYGVEVIYQQLIDISFKEQLKGANIHYTELPILENDVVTYVVDGIKKYACIVHKDSPDTYVENVYITTEIPLDMQWENLILDCEDQKAGEAPMNLKTKAKVILQKAIKMAKENDNQEDFNWFMPTEDPKPEAIKLALAAMGYDVDMILSMDHHDIDKDFLNALI